MSKKRTLSGFNEVASNSNINNDNNNDNDVLDNILNERKPKDKTHIFKGYYLENEVANTIDRITEGKPKGTKSILINEIIKKYLQEHGHM